MSFYEWFFLEKDRPAAGLFSWSHLLSVTIVFATAIFLGFFLGKKFKDNQKAQRNTFLIITAIILTLYIGKQSFLLATSDDIGNTLIEALPLFFCDMMLIIIPLATFSRGRLQEICFDFIAIGGFIMGFMGNYFAANIYASHPAISFLSLISSIDHSIAAFAAMFIFRSGLNKMEKRNIPFVIGVLFIYMTITLIVDYTLGKNFMFFMGGEGTPFDIFFNLVKGNLILYQIIVYILQCGYIGVFYLIYYPLAKFIKSKTKKEVNE